MILKEFSQEAVIADQLIELKTGKMARQANGSVILKAGNAVLLATATMSKKPKEGIDFLPLTIEYTEKMYAGGKIPGGFFKREARPSTDETLTARLIDRPLRPSFPKGFHHDIQIIINVLSYDPAVSLEPLSIIAASAALTVSDIPFNGPVGAVVVGLIGDEYVFNPSPDQLSKSDLNLVVAGNIEAVLMVEAGANELKEEQVIQAIIKGHAYIKESIQLQEALGTQCAKPKIAVPEPAPEIAVLEPQIVAFLGQKISDVLGKGLSKQDVEQELSLIEESVKSTFLNEDKSNEGYVAAVYNTIKKKQIRSFMMVTKIRVDGRKPNEIRPLSIEAGVLPSTHGSALFTRGETQGLGVLTLGTSTDEMIRDNLGVSGRRKYFFHYNFPPFSVGECGRLATSRRELGHGALAERALIPVLPDLETRFPYTIRLVSEILESNGSSSMASVCAGSLALMDGGVPTKASVSGIAMGLLLDGRDHLILSDIQGLEDHYGDMDFKVAGTNQGITALQLDIKISGLSQVLLEKALEQAKAGRLHILHEMDQVLSESRQSLSPHAPQVHSLKIDPEKIGMIIGPGGKMIRKIEEESGAVVTIAEGNTGDISVFSSNKENLDKAVAMIIGIAKEPEVGESYEGRVTKIMNFGAFIELLPGKEGLLHISKIAKQRVERVEDFLKVDDIIPVKVDKVDEKNRINLVRD